MSVSLLLLFSMMGPWYGYFSIFTSIPRRRLSRDLCQRCLPMSSALAKAIRKVVNMKTLMYTLILAFSYQGLNASAADSEPTDQGGYDLFGFFLGSGPHVCERAPEYSGTGSMIKRADMPKSSKVTFNAKTLTDGYVEGMDAFRCEGGKGPWGIGKVDWDDEIHWKAAMGGQGWPGGYFFRTFVTDLPGWKLPPTAETWQKCGVTFTFWLSTQWKVRAIKADWSMCEGVAMTPDVLALAKQKYGEPHQSMDDMRNLGQRLETIGKWVGEPTKIWVNGDEAIMVSDWILDVEPFGDPSTTKRARQSILLMNLAVIGEHAADYLAWEEQYLNSLNSGVMDEAEAVF